MTNTEKLLEAVTYAEENEMNWWEVFDSPADALTIIKLARKEEPEEGQIVCILSIQNSSEDLFESHTAYSVYKSILKLMHKELKEIFS